MARNEEKAQSMLYRFREAQAAELGMSRKSDRRPRVASSCKSLRECERWRGEILREISRKVSKIQDAGLTDYEVRDLNDEINKLMREKRHWENQIVALGGVNFKRSTAMLDEDGKEVPGTRGYKYFGRAKELPGVRELFQKSTEVSEEDQSFTFYKKFLNQGPDYYGDLDENDEALLQREKEAEEEAWADAYKSLAQALEIPLDNVEVPPIPRPDPKALLASAAAGLSITENGSTVDGDGDAAMNGEKKPVVPPALAFLTADELAAPVMPTKAEMEQVLLEIRKKALLEEYLGKEG
ncbi:NineTeen Complex (NTC) component [Tulasnella sp. 424]|nr:NineTeen Complex (NTC) component [Tulasnella sp. 424]KAG8982160.1 NineTeen Complex (NTC) component [Tulasnella sp. 425]